MTWLTFHEPARDIHLPPSPGRAGPGQNQKQKKEQRTMAWESVKVIDNHLPAADWWSPADNSQNDKLRRHVNHQEESASESARQSPVGLAEDQLGGLPSVGWWIQIPDWLTNWLTDCLPGRLTRWLASPVAPLFLKNWLQSNANAIGNALHFIKHDPFDYYAPFWWPRIGDGSRSGGICDIGLMEVIAALFGHATCHV